MPKFNETVRCERGVDLNGTSTGSFFARNWYPVVAQGSLGSAALYHTRLYQWYNFGTTGTTTNILCSADGTSWLSVGSLASYQTSCCMEGLGSNDILLGGGLTTGTAGKIRYSSDRGVTWTTVNVGPSDTTPVTSMTCGLDIGYLARVGMQVYRSYLASGPYTSVLTLNSPGGVVSNQGSFSAPIVIAYGQYESTFYVSSDGLSWTPRTFPDLFIPRGVAFGLHPVTGEECFLAGGEIGASSYIYASSDGFTWTRLSSQPMGSLGPVASLGRNWIWGETRTDTDQTKNVVLLTWERGNLIWEPVATFTAGLLWTVAVRKRNNTPCQLCLFTTGLVKASLVG